MEGTKPVNLTQSQMAVLNGVYSSSPLTKRGRDSGRAGLPVPLEKRRLILLGCEPPPDNQGPR